MGPTKAEETQESDVGSKYDPVGIFKERAYDAQTSLSL